MNKTTLLRVPACALVVAIVLGAGAPVARGDTLLTGIDLFSTPGPDVPGNNMYSPPLVTQINAGTTLTFNGALGTVTLPAAVPIDGNPSVFYSAYPGLASTPHPVDTFIGRDVPSGSLTTPGTTIPISVQALSLQSIGTVGGYKLYVLGADTTATNVPNLTPAVNAVTGFVSALFAATHQTPPSPLVPPTALGGKITINPLNPTLNPPIGNNFNSVLPLNVYVVATNGTDTEYATFTENSIGDPGLAGTAVPFSRVHSLKVALHPRLDLIMPQPFVARAV